jgi:hypothetical protein
MLPDSCKIDPFYKQSTNVRVAEFLIVLLLNMDGDVGNGRATVTLTRPYHLPALVVFFFHPWGPSPMQPSLFRPQPHGSGLKTACNGVYLQPCPLYICRNVVTHVGAADD